MDPDFQSPILREAELGRENRFSVFPKSRKISLLLGVGLLTILVLIAFFNPIRKLRVQNLIRLIPGLVSNHGNSQNEEVNSGFSEIQKNIKVPKSQKISDIPKDAIIKQVSQDMTRAIFQHQSTQGKGVLSITSCAECSGYDEIVDAQFYTIKGDLMFIGKKNGNYFIQIKGKAYGPFKPAKERVNYIDGRAPAMVDPFTAIRFNNQKDSLAFSVIENGKHVVYRDGVIVGSYEFTGIDPDIYDLVFSKDGTKFGYSVAYHNENGTWARSFSVINGKKEREHNNRIYSLRFTADSKHWLYHVQENNLYEVFLDGIKQGGTAVTVDSTHEGPLGNYEYILENDVLSNSGSTLIIDGKKIDTARNFTEFQFSPDGKRYAYTKLTADNNVTNQQVILDGKEIYEAQTTDQSTWPIHDLEFSTDSARLYFTDGGKVIQDGKKILLDLKDFDMYDFGTLNDGKTYFYRYYDRMTNKPFFSIFGTEYPLYTIDSIVGFSPDFKHFAIWIPADSVSAYKLLVDGEPRSHVHEYIPVLREAENPLALSLIHSARFSKDSKYIEYVAVIKNELWRIVEPL